MLVKHDITKILTQFDEAISRCKDLTLVLLFLQKARFKNEKSLKNSPIAGPRKNKYNAIKTNLDGHIFDSKLESRRWVDLKLMEKTGLIFELKRQTCIHLMPRVKYKTDFDYVNKTGVHIYEDVKGVMTERFNLIKRIWKQCGPSPLHVVVFQRGWFVKDVINPIGVIQ